MTFRHLFLLYLLFLQFLDLRLPCLLPKAIFISILNLRNQKSEFQKTYNESIENLTEQINSGKRKINKLTVVEKFGFRIVDVDLINQFNGRNALLVKVRKSEAEDALTIGTDVKKFVAEYDGGAGIDIAIWDDQVSVLEERVSLLVRNAVLGFALVFLFLVIMLDLRLALWVAMGVPISFLGAFLFFDPFGVNINMMFVFTLFCPFFYNCMVSSNTWINFVFITK